jgi:hypothetical protein
MLACTVTAQLAATSVAQIKSQFDEDIEVVISGTA